MDGMMYSNEGKQTESNEEQRIPKWALEMMQQMQQTQLQSASLLEKLDEQSVRVSARERKTMEGTNIEQDTYSPPGLETPMDNSAIHSSMPLHSNISPRDEEMQSATNRMGRATLQPLMCIMSMG